MIDPAAESMARQVEIAELSLYIDALRLRMKEATARIDLLQAEEQEYFDRARAEAAVDDHLADARFARALAALKARG